MTLGHVLERIGERLSSVLSGPPKVGTAQPTAGTDLPMLVLYATDATEVRAGIGNMPRPTQRTPLRVTSTISVADPVLRFGDGDDVNLLSDGGRTLRLPHGGLVHQDGASPPPPLGAADISIDVDGTPYTLVSGAPAALQFQLDGELVRFATPLAGTAVHAAYYIGEWDVTTSRYRGQLAIDVVAATAAAVADLSDAVGDALRPGIFGPLGTAYVLTPTAWGPIGIPEPALSGGRRRTIAFRFDLELETAVIPTGGGVIADIDISLLVPNPPGADVAESFSVP